MSNSRSKKMYSDTDKKVRHILCPEAIALVLSLYLVLVLFTSQAWAQLEVRLLTLESIDDEV
ncbi:MAG: hypothetical protein KAR47_16010 [Planctomycetes bacterium]|nr:hypothetical protein [Planctomycetota bacterium]